MAPPFTGAVASGRAEDKASGDAPASRPERHAMGRSIGGHVAGFETIRRYFSSTRIARSSVVPLFWRLCSALSSVQRGTRAESVRF